MNILFLVMNFLLIFVFLNGMVLKNASFFSSQKTLTLTYLASKLTLESKWERYKYNSYLKKSISSPKDPSSQKTHFVSAEVFHSHRMKKNGFIPWKMESFSTIFRFFADRFFQRTYRTSFN